VEGLDKVDSWLLENADRLDLQVRNFDNKILLEVGIHDLEASILVKGVRYYGRGTGVTEGLALKKACAEAIERFFLNHFKFVNSNGIAIHESFERAALAATNELVERDLFLCHFLTSTPFFPSSIESIFLDKIIRKLNVINVSVQFYFMGDFENGHASLCVIGGLKASVPFGYILGTAAGRGEAADLLAFLEAFRNYAHLRPEQAISIDDFLAKNLDSTVSFKDHGNLALNTDYAEMLKSIYFSGPTIRPDSTTLLKDLRSHKLDMRDTPFEKSPLVVVRSSSVTLQSLFVGLPSSENLNLSRLKEFKKGRSFKLTTLPHPFN
jgi:hypothetical protein